MNVQSTLFEFLKGQYISLGQFAIRGVAREFRQGVQDQIFRQKGVVMERFFPIRAWHMLQLMTRDELKVITLERCHVFLFINERNNHRQVISTI